MLLPPTSLARSFTSRTDPEDAHDGHLLAILIASPIPDESPTSEYDRKERQLASSIAMTSGPAANALHRRLAQPLIGDLLAEAFARLPPRRRARLLALLRRHLDQLLPR